jgi:hypothetical protein
MRALTFLNISHNRIGDLVLPEGWTKGDSGYPDFGKYKHTDGRKQDRAPEGSKPDGVIAVANAIKNMGALTSLNLASNGIGGYFDNHSYVNVIATPAGIATLYCAHPTCASSYRSLLTSGPAAIADIPAGLL